MLLVQGNIVYVTSVTVNFGNCDAIKYDRHAQEIQFYAGGQKVSIIKSVDVPDWNNFQNLVHQTFQYSTAWNVFKPAAILKYKQSKSPGRHDVEVNFDSGDFTI